MAPGREQNTDPALNAALLPSLLKIVENASDGVWVIDTNSVTTYVNQRMCDMLGYSRTELINREFTKFVFAGERQDHLNRVALRAQVLTDHYERRLVHKNGKSLWISISARALMDEKGTLLGSFAICSDITEHKKPEQIQTIVSETQTQLAQLNEIAPVFKLVAEKIHEIVGGGYVGTTVVDESGESILINNLVGIGKDFYDLVKRFNVNPVEKKYPIKDAPLYEMDILNAGKLLPFEGGLYPLLMKKIPKRVCQVVEKQLQINHIQVMGMVSEGKNFGGVIILTANDVSGYKDSIETIIHQATQVIKRIRSEQLTQSSEARLKLTFDAINDGYWDWDVPAGEVIVNDNYYLMLGYKPEGMKTTYDSFRKLVHHDDIALLTKKINEVFKEGNNYLVEFRMKTKAEGYKWVLSRGSVVSRDANGTPLRVVGTHTDISERKQTEYLREVFIETQREILQVNNLEELFQLVGTNLVKIMQDGYVVINQIDKQTGLIHLAGLYGFGELFDQLTKDTKLSKTSFEVSLDKIDPNTRSLWRSNSLIKYAPGLYGILNGKLPKKMCDLVKNRLGYQDVYIMGCQWQGLDIGGFVFFVKKNPEPIKDMLETLVNDTSIAIQRIHSEEQVQVANDRFRNIFEKSPVGIVTLDANYNYLSINSEYSHICGYSEDELKKLSFKEITHPEDIQPQIDQMQQLMSDRVDVCNLLKRYIHKDGQQVWAKLIVNKVCDANGSFQYLLAMVTDITREVAVEEALNDNRRFLKMVLDTIPTMVFVRDNEGKYRLANKAFASAMGRTPDEMLGSTDNELDARAKKAREVQQQDLEVITTGNDWVNSDLEITFPVGTTRNVHFIKRALPNVGHMNPAVLGVITDISERKKFELELFEKEKKYRTLFETMRQGVFYQLADGTVFDVNPAALEIFGLSKEQFIRQFNAKTDWNMMDENGKYIELPLRPTIEVFRTAKPVIEKTISFLNPQKNQIVWAVVNAVPQFRQGELTPYQAYVTINEITALKEIEKELRISEMRYRTLIQNSPSGVYQADKDGRYIYFNDRLLQMNGMQSSDLLGDGWFDGLLPEDRIRISHLWKDYVKNGGKWSAQYRLVNQKTDEIVWVLDEAEPLFDIDGKVIGFIGSKVNLNEQKKTENLIKKSEEKYRLLTETMKDVVWTLDTTTMRFTYLSPSIFDLRGFTADEVINSPLSAALTEQGAREFEKTIKEKVAQFKAKKITSSDFFTYEIQQVHRNGTLIWTEVITSMHENLETRHLELRGATRNIADRKKSEQALLQSEEKHRLLVENSHDIIYTLSKKGEFTFVSNAWTALLGFPVQEAHGKPFSKFVHSSDVKKCTAFFEQVINKKQRQSGLEYRMKHADGSWRWYTASALPTFDGSGKCTGLEGTCRDINEQKIAENALLESEERYRLLVEKSPVGIMVVQKGKFLYANSTAVKLFGFSSLDDLVGKSILSYIHPGSRQALFKRITEIRKDMPNPLMEIKIIQKNGEVVETESTSSQIKVMGEDSTLVFAQDISSRKKAEDQIRKNADDLALINVLNESVNRGDPLSVTIKRLIDSTKRMFLGNGAAVYLLSDNSEYLEMQHFYINEKIVRWIEKTIGIKIPLVRIKLDEQSQYRAILASKQFRVLETRKQIIGLMKEFTDNPVYKKLIPTIYNQLGINSVVAIPMISHGESVGLLELSSKVPFNEENRSRLEFISSELGSIIRRKQAEEALRESEEKFRQIVERSNDIFLRQNFENLQIEYISPNAYTQLGYSQEEALQMENSMLTELVHPDDASIFDKFRRTIVEMHQQGQNTNIREYRLKKKTGGYIWVKANYSLVQDEEGRPKQVIGTLSDITSQKVNENILKFRVKIMQLSNTLSVDELLVTILDEIEKYSESCLGFCHFLTEDEKKTTRVVWSTNLSKVKDFDYSAALEHESAKNIWRTVVRQKRAMILNDPQSIPETLVSTGGQKRVNRAMVVPIIRSEKVVSVFAVANKPYDYNPEDVEYISTLADLAWDVIENKLIQSALQESESVFSAFMENSPIYVFFKDKEIRAKRLSRNFEQMLGKPLDEILNKTMDELFPSDLSKSMIEDDKRILNEGRAISVDEELNGRYYTTIKFPIFKDGKPEFLAGFTIDNTDRILSERKLAESEELYRIISSVVSDYLFSTRINDDGQLELQWVAGAFEAITGYNMAEYKQAGGWRAMVYPEDLAVDDQDMQTLSQNKKVITEIRTVRKDGSIIWVRSYAQPIWDEKTHRLVGINGAVQDITERKKAEEEIKQAAHEFAVLYDTAKDLSMQRDPQIILRTISDRACTLLGSKNSFIFLFDSDANELELRFSRDAKHQVGYRIKMGVGLSGIVAQTLSPLIINDYRNWANRLTGIVTSDVSAIMGVPMMYGGQLIGVLGVEEYYPNTRKFTEDDAHFLTLFASQAAGAVYSSDLFEQLRINAAELEKRVDERTRELQSKNKELETFTYTVSHDLKAPLRGISGYSTLLMEDYADHLDEDGKRYLTHLVNSTERMNVLIEDLLAYSRIERREINKVEVNLNELIDKILIEHQPEVAARNLQVKKELECGTLFTDLEAISQALRNIIDNAVKFTRDCSTPTIIIRSNQLEDHILLSIEDNGIGFDMKYYDKIFEIFQRLHLTEDYPGTGVGLAVVRKAIERLGGKIWAVSQPGEGSTFFMEFPR